ncbi:uncharacterized protein ARMOST_17391 [Armillaria ostoyae]|uniref:Uncharacterized protein n=1 Tax=Armillaria ostoyae TaxID=47428 RepID=A0A284RYY9_ARMOS|nr:uncharacterized protein ARMOST_17391 [Armillaria ostoyae]
MEQACGTERFSASAFTSTGNISFASIPSPATIPFNIGHEYTGHRRQEHASGPRSNCRLRPNMLVWRVAREGWSDASVVRPYGWFSPLGCRLARARRWFANVGWDVMQLGRNATRSRVF